jgi:hypothetical protein
MYNLSMGKFIDRKGLRYGRLQVLSDAGADASKKRLWKCLCECGTEVTVPAGSLVTGNTRSCGCYHREVITKHGGWQKSSYNTWRAMLRRCTIPEDKDFPRYGARGIAVCAEWKDYARFVADMGEPEEGQTLDRIDGAKGYYKENCRWASGHVQAVNTKRRESKTGHRGVVYLQKDQRWLANITVHGKRYYSRVCTSLEAAVHARQALEQQYWRPVP